MSQAHRAVDPHADAYDRLWTPYRMAYIKGEGKPKHADDLAGCPFCVIPNQDDADALVVARGERVYAVLNLYPYNAGHLLVVPYTHVPDYTDIDTETTREFGAFTQHAMRVIRKVSNPQGFNLGMNQGEVSGAGIAAHLHQHVIPRWGGDTNFMPVIASTRVLPQLLSDTRDLLSEAWAAEPYAGG